MKKYIVFFLVFIFISISCFAKEQDEEKITDTLKICDIRNVENITIKKDEEGINKTRFISFQGSHKFFLEIEQFISSPSVIDSKMKLIFSAFSKISLENSKNIKLTLLFPNAENEFMEITSLIISEKKRSKEIKIYDFLKNFTHFKIEIEGEVITSSSLEIFFELNYYEIK